MIIPLADHPLITAVPFVLPGFLVFAGIAFIAIRDRHQRRRRA